MPSCSKSAHGEALRTAHSFVQWSSMTFFCAADMRLYFDLLKTMAKVVAYSGAFMWYFVTLSMPNRITEPHGKVTASATPFSMTSCNSGAEACTLGPHIFV